jgi:hypothetical protein
MMGRTEVKLREKPLCHPRCSRDGLSSSHTIEGAGVLLGPAYFGAARRPPNIAGHATPQELAAVVYLGERTLAFVAIAGGAFLGHGGSLPSDKAPVGCLFLDVVWTRCLRTKKRARREEPRPRSTRLLRFRGGTSGGRGTYRHR